MFPDQGKCHSGARAGEVADVSTGIIMGVGQITWVGLEEGEGGGEGGLWRRRRNPRFDIFRGLHHWPISRKSQKLFGPDKPFLKLQYFDFKIRKGKFVAKFHAWKRLCFF